jgi:L-aminopeptidase/D-esterase-like protein
VSNDTLTAIEGIKVGHAALPEAPSGCTVILPSHGAIAGVDIRGGAPGTYGTDTLNPLNLVDRIHGLFFTGGSAFGLSVADGLRCFQKSAGVGFDSGAGLIPIIAGAVIFDLGVNRSAVYPDAALGFLACQRASEDPVEEGNVGAGLGATVGKLYGPHRAMKAGLGSACIETVAGIKVGALMVVNAFGDVIDPELNSPIAGCRDSKSGATLIGMEAEILKMKEMCGFPDIQNTVVGTIVTNAKLNKTQLTKVAQMAHDGLARTIYPAHTLFDGDTIFALSCGEIENVDVSILGTLAARVTADAVLRGVRKSRSLEGIPAFEDIFITT